MLRRIVVLSSFAVLAGFSLTHVVRSPLSAAARPQNPPTIIRANAANLAANSVTLWAELSSDPPAQLAGGFCWGLERNEFKCQTMPGWPPGSFHGRNMSVDLVNVLKPAT